MTVLDFTFIGLQALCEVSYKNHIFGKKKKKKNHIFDSDSLCVGGPPNYPQAQ